MGMGESLHRESATSEVKVSTIEVKVSTSEVQVNCNPSILNPVCV